MSKLRANERQCSNCQNVVLLDRAITVQHKGRVVVVVCEACQQAKKLSITIAREQPGGPWSYFQLFPTEC